MSEFKHTPGPWFVFPRAHHDDGPGAFCIGNSESFDNADILCTRFQWPERAEEMQANARLLAAAPELLKFAICDNALDLPGSEGRRILALYGFDGNGLATDFVAQLRDAAIAKVKGESNA